MASKLSLFVVGALACYAAAASAVVWSEEGAGDMSPAYWYDYTYGTGASIETSTTSDNVKVGDAVVKAGSASNGAGFGFSWKQDASYKDTPISLAAYKGMCLTYRSTAPFRIDFKQSTISDENYYGSELSAGAKKVFLPFANLKQGWKSSSTVSWNVGKQTGVQFGFKNTHATTSVYSNKIEIVSVILADSCVTFAPELLDPFKSETDPAATLNEGDTLSYDLSAMFTDADGDDLAYTVKIVGENVGSVRLADSLFAKTGVLNLITGENPKGSSVVTITATDPQNKSVAYIVTVTTVNGENAPVAVNDEYETKEETKLTVSLENNVLKNDYDADGDAFLPVLVKSTAHGTLTFNENLGTFTYVPEKDFFGEDSFTYKLVEVARADDPDYEVKTGNVATVTITVTNVDDPITVTVSDSSFTVDSNEYKLGDTITVNEDFDAFVAMLPTANVEFSDPDVKTTTGITLSASANAKLLTVEYYLIGLNHVIQVNPVANANGIAKVSLFAVKDTASVWFYVNVLPVDDPPVAVDDSYSVFENMPLAVVAAKGVLANDSYPDDPKATLTAELVDSTAHGSLELKANGSFTYTPEKDFSGTETFTYRVVVGEATSEFATVSIEVANASEPPVLQLKDFAIELTEDGKSVTYKKTVVSTWATDPENDPLYFTFKAADEKIRVTYVSGVLSVVPANNAFGETYIQGTVTDSLSAPVEFQIPVTITPVPDKPIVVWRGVAWIDPEKQHREIVLDSIIYDVDGPEELTFEIVNANKMLDVSIDEGMLKVKPAADSIVLDKAGYYYVTVRAWDATDTATVKLTFRVGEESESIAPVLATPKATWQNAILADRGVAAIFDMQGRVMWKAKLPVSEADVRNASARVQGRKILQVNRQTWTIK